MGVETIVPIASFALTFGIIYVAITAKNREKMAMIEKGIDPSQFRENQGKSYVGLKFGLVAIGVAVGLVVGSLLDQYSIIDEEVAYIAMAFLFGGVGLVAGHFIARKLQAQDEEREELKNKGQS